MAIINSNIKRPQQWFTVNSSDSSHSSKRPRYTIMSNPSTVSRISRYPESKAPLLRAVHAPCRPCKFPLSTVKSSTRQSIFPANGICNDRSDILHINHQNARKSALASIRFLKGKEVVQVDTDSHNDAVSEDSSVHEVHTVEDEHEDQNLQESAKPKVIDSGLNQNNSTSSVVSDFTDSDLNVVHAEKMLDRLSLGPENLDLSSVHAYKKLLHAVDNQTRTDTLKRLSYEIQLNERRRAAFDLLRPKKELVEKVPWEPFVPITKGDQDAVSRAFSANRKKVLVTHEKSNIEISGDKFQCLEPGAWLNDEVINLYLELLKERERREPQKFLNCHFFNTFFYKKLISGKDGYDFKSVRSWTSQKKLGYGLHECDKIFVPIHREVHWCLAVIDKKDKKFQYLDSKKGMDTQVLKVLARYFVDEVKDKTGKDIDVSSWKKEFVEDLPVQKNGYDCGVFMIKYADFYSRNIGLCFNQKHMSYFRLRTAKEILRLKAD